MIHEDGGSRSKGSPAGEILLQFIEFNLGTPTRREEEQESDEDSRAQVQNLC